MLAHFISFFCSYLFSPGHFLPSHRSVVFSLSPHPFPMWILFLCCCFSHSLHFAFFPPMFYPFSSIFIGRRFNCCNYHLPTCSGWPCAQPNPHRAPHSLSTPLPRRTSQGRVFFQQSLSVRFISVRMGLPVSLYRCPCESPCIHLLTCGHDALSHWGAHWSTHTHTYTQYFAVTTYFAKKNLYGLHALTTICTVCFFVRKQCPAYVLHEMLGVTLWFDVNSRPKWSKL